MNQYKTIAHRVRNFRSPKAQHQNVRRTFLQLSYTFCLPSHLRNSSTLPLFKSRLKTHLFMTTFCQQDFCQLSANRTKYIFCRDKSVLVATSIILSRQKKKKKKKNPRQAYFCHDKRLVAAPANDRLRKWPLGPSVSLQTLTASPSWRRFIQQCECVTNRLILKELCLGVLIAVCI